MKCPFLEEIIVSYCKACPIKKMIPSSSVKPDSFCAGDYSSCPAFQDFAHKTGEGKMTIKEVEMAQPETGTAKKKECIWMKAGVIAYRLCTQNFDCKNCEFDQTLMDEGEAYGGSSPIAEGLKKLRQLPATERQCRYMLTGDLPYKLCSNNYECWHCATDQAIQDMLDANVFLQKRRARAETKKTESVKGFAFRDDVYYHPSHYWLKIEKEGVVRIGIDDFAQRLLGSITSMRLPEAGSAANEFELRAGRRSARLSPPLRGKVVEVNRNAVANPELINRDPFNQGWLFTFQPTDASEVGRLTKGATAKKWLEEEGDRLGHSLESEAGVTVADGGEIIPELHAKISDEEWHRLIERFLKKG